MKRMILIGILILGSNGYARVSQGAINRCLNNAKIEIWGCNAGLGHYFSDLSAQGKMVLSFKIAPNGRISSLAVEEPVMEGKQLNKCVKKVLKQCRFPKSADYTRVSSVPLMFGGY